MQFLKIFTIFFSLSISYFAFGEKTLIACTGQEPVHFDPALATDAETMDAGAFLIFDRLMMVDYGSEDISSSLAKNWSLGVDLKSFTVNLRDDVSFHSNAIFTPSRNFNADDVIYTFERQLDPKHPWHDVFQEEYQYFESIGLDKIIAKIEKIDDYTVKFYLNEFDASFIAKLTMGFLSIYSKEYMEQLLAQGDVDKLRTHPIGTGQWVFDYYDQKAQKIYYTANQDYFLGKPNIDRLEINILPDSKERRQRLQEGLCHHISGPSASDIEALQDNDDYKLIRQAGYSIYYLELNTINKPLDDKNVRKALAMAIDKQRLIDEARGGMEIVAKNPIPPKMWSYNKDIIDYPYNPQKAKELLIKAGHAEGFTLKYLTVEGDIRHDKKTFEFLKEHWGKINVKLEKIEVNPDDFFNKVLKGIDSDVALLGWGADIDDPDNILYNLLSCSSIGALNSSNWCHKEFEDTIIQAKTEANYEKRVRLYQKAQEIFHEELPFIPVFHAALMEIISKKLKNYQGKVFGNQKFPPHILKLED